MSQSDNKTKQRMIRAAVILLMMSLPVMRAQVGPKAPPPEKKPTRPSVAKPPARTRPVARPQESRALAELRNSFVQIPAGEFMMGSESGDIDEKPVHRVRISHSFEMGKYEVTQAQWQAVMGNDPSYFKDCPDCPVEQVSWDDAQQFTVRLNERNDGYIYRLPTEAEWEYACRAGSTEDYAGNLDTMAWHRDNTRNPHPVGQKQPNSWGLYDMYGNVEEWCQDWYNSNYYAQSSSANPTGPSTGTYRVERGGGWSSPAQSFRSANRFRDTPSFRDMLLGLRLVRTPAL